MLPRSCFLAPKLLRLLSSPLSPLPSSRLWPLSMVMASNLSSFHLRTESDLRKPRRVHVWQSPGFNGKMQCGIAPLTGLQPDKFIYFSSYALCGLILPFSSFFILLENYSLQLHHLSPHSIMLMVIFVQLCEMYVCARSLVRLFRLFHMLCSFGRSPSPLSCYYFQHWTKGPAGYIAALIPSKCDRWMEDWVIM
jgi:hypothetical protein